MAKGKQRDSSRKVLLYFTDIFDSRSKGPLASKSFRPRGRCLSYLLRSAKEIIDKDLCRFM